MIPISWGALDLTSSDDVHGLFSASNTYTVDASLQTTPRRGTYPLLASISNNQRDIPLTLLRPFGSSLTTAEYISAVEGAFREGTQGTLVVLLDDGSTQAQIDCVVTSRTRASAGGAFEVTLTALRPYFEATSPTTDTSSPVTNAGNTAVLPSLSLTCSTHATRKRFTVAGAGRGGGLKQVPIKFSVSDANLTASNAYVYVSGVSVPFYVGGAGGASSYVWALVDTASDGSATTVDIVYGSGISNPLAGALDDGGMDWTSSGSTNSSWKWDDLTVGGRPGRSGVWRPALVGAWSSASVGLTTNSSTSLVFSAGSTSANQNDADAIVMETGGLGFTTLANVSRVTTSAVSNPRYVRTRDAGSWLLTTDWSNTTAATVTTDITLTNGVEILIGIGVQSTGTLTLSKVSGNPWTLTLANTPTVTLVHTQNLDYYDATLVVGTDTITFNDFMVDDGTLEISHGESGWTISSSVAGARFYGPNDRIAFSDPDVFIELAAGANTVTNSITGAAYSITHRAGYA